MVLKPQEALERVRALLARNDDLTVAGIAGPGDPLANDAIFETLAAIHREFPDLTLCVSTNGLSLRDRIEDLMRVGVKSITITINALTQKVAEKVYSRVSYRGKTLSGRAAAEQLVINQQRGLINAIDAGFMVKVNTVYIPGVNDAEIPLIAWFAGIKGADIMNIMPLIPQAGLEGIQRPSVKMLEKMRSECSLHIAQVRHCAQCGTDACGALGEDKYMDLELLNARIGEEYCETVSQ
jgi:nitrogen fixation protein NifB